MTDYHHGRSYHVIKVLSDHILEENRKLQEEVANKNRIIGFIGNNLHTLGLYLCGTCYIPCNDDFVCNCGIKHCIQCCTKLNDVYLDPHQQTIDYAYFNPPLIKRIEIIRIDFYDHNPDDPDYIQRNKARRYSRNLIFFNGEDHQWYRIKISEIPVIVDPYPNIPIEPIEPIEPIDTENNDNYLRIEIELEGRLLTEYDFNQFMKCCNTFIDAGDYNEIDINSIGALHDYYNFFLSFPKSE